MKIRNLWVAASAVLLVLSIFAVALFVSTSSTADVMKPAAEKTGMQNQCIGYDSTKDILVVGTHQNKLLAYDGSGKKIWEFGTSSAVCQIKIDSKSRKLYAGDSSGKVFILSLDDGSKLGVVDCGTRLYSFDVTNDGTKLVLSAGPSGMKHYLFFFDNNGNQHSITNIGNTSLSVTFSSDENSVFLGDNRAELMQFDLNGKEIKKITLNYQIVDLKDIPKLKELVALTVNSQYHVFKEDLTPIRSGTTSGIATSIGTSEDGNYIAIGTQEGFFYILNKDGKQIYFKKAPYTITNILFTNKEAFVTGYGDFLFQIDLKSLATLQLYNILNGILNVLIILLPLLFLVSMVLTFEGSTRQAKKILHTFVKYKTAYLLLIPTFVLLIIFNYYPVVIAFIRSFTDWSRSTTNMAVINFIGFQNFKTMFTEGYFLIGLQNLLIIIVTSFIKVLTVPLLVAELVYAMKSDRKKYWFRFLFVFPMVVPGVVGALMWLNIYDPSIGLLNQLLKSFNLSGLERVWLGDPSTAIWAIVFMGFPFIDAFAFLVYYGGLINIPTSLFEAAKVDGSNPLYNFFKIHIPMIQAQFKLLIILAFINSVQDFTAIYLLTAGGPGSATYVPGLELYYNATKFGRYGYACALGVVLFVVILAGTIVNLRMQTNNSEYD